jgi:gamma-carbonic anhydrase
MTDTPSLGITIASIHGKAPRIHSSAFIAPGCRIIGDVEIGPDASIWYNCVIRADVNRVVIGARSNVQDGSVVHCDSPKPGRPEGFATIIGDDVLIGHMAMVHGCTLEDRAFVGLGAIVMDGCTIRSDGMLAAGALLTQGKVIERRQLWAGRPAKYVRDLTDEALTQMQAGVQGYVVNARIHSEALRGAAPGNGADGAPS